MFVSSRFLINPHSLHCPVFRGVHDPYQTWEQWAIPLFGRAEAERIVNWSRCFPANEETLYWEGDVVIHRRAQDPTWEEVRYLPDALGRYAIGAQWWTWKTTDRPTTGRRHHLRGRRRRRPVTTVLAAADGVGRALIG